MNNQQWILARRPSETALDNTAFALQTAPLSPLQDGQVRLKNAFLSIDPWIRGRLNEDARYADALPPGGVIPSGCAGVVVESRHPDWPVDTPAIGLAGWQTYSVFQADELMRVSREVPLSFALGAAGMTGVTAWYGVSQICQPQAGQTFVVSAACGAVGSIAAQLAALRGCRVVGIAGDPAKCRRALEDFPFTACISYRADDFAAQLAQACPDGIDHYFDNVGGAVLDTVLPRMNPHGSIAVCGMISRHSGSPSLHALDRVLFARLRMQGYIIADHLDQWGAALAELIPLIRKRKIVVKETRFQGLNAAPDALLAMLQGKTYGKTLVAL